MAHGALNAKLNVAASQTDSSVIAAVANSKITVLALYVLAGGTATDVTFNSKGSGAGSAISALFACAANSGVVLAYNPKGWFSTSVGEALTVTTGTGATTGLGVVYETVRA